MHDVKPVDAMRASLGASFRNVLAFLVYGVLMLLLLFVALLPLGQVTRDVSSESSEVAWIPARVAAEQADAGALALMPPTYLTSMEIGTHASPDEVLEVAASRSVEMFCPTVEPLGSGWTLSMPDRLRPMVAERRRG